MGRHRGGRRRQRLRDGQAPFDQLPHHPGRLPDDLGAAADAFVTKLNAAGSALVYSTYLGGSAPMHGNGIAVDRSGNAYVTGYTFDQLPHHPGPSRLLSAAATMPS